VIGVFDVFSDPQIQEAVNRAIILWALISARMIPIVQLVPYLGGKAAPQTVKLALTVALTALVYPVIWGSGAADALPDGTLALSMLLGKELLLGVMCGFVTALVFDSVRVAGQLIDNARGQTQSTSFAPQLPERVSVTGNYLYQLGIVMFLLIGGHRLFIAALIHSFAAIPPQTIPDMGDHMAAITLGIVRLAADSVTLGVLLAFPVIAAILLTDLCLALINRAAPQINVFFLGMPIKGMLGIFVVLLTLQMFSDRLMDEAITGISFIENFLDSAQVTGGAPSTEVAP
jgi:flagellar biosynthetic protein FliR